jgi:hypothetical protein
MEMGWKQVLVVDQPFLYFLIQVPEKIIKIKKRTTA